MAAWILVLLSSKILSQSEVELQQREREIKKMTEMHIFKFIIIRIYHINRKAHQITYL